MAIEVKVSPKRTFAVKVGTAAADIIEILADSNWRESRESRERWEDETKAHCETRNSQQKMTGYLPGC